MCGRYALYGPSSRLREHFEVDFDQIGFVPHYNIAPRQPAPVIRWEAGTHTLAVLRWGLVPSWAKDDAIGNRLINARAETAAEKPAFRAAFKTRRCLVPCNGFYEWAATGDGKQPYFIRLKGGEPMALGGLWEHWRAPTGEALESFTILTIAANERIASIHERMPVILPPETWGLWLNPARTPVQVQALVRAYPADAMTLDAVDKRVGNTRNDDPQLLSPI